MIFTSTSLHHSVLTQCVYISLLRHSSSVPYSPSHNFSIQWCGETQMFRFFYQIICCWCYQDPRALSAHESALIYFLVLVFAYYQMHSCYPAQWPGLILEELNVADDPINTIDMQTSRLFENIMLTRFFFSFSLGEYTSLSTYYLWSLSLMSTLVNYLCHVRETCSACFFFFFFCHSLHFSYRNSQNIKSDNR